MYTIPLIASRKGIVCSAHSNFISVVSTTLQVILVSLEKRQNFKSNYSCIVRKSNAQIHCTVNDHHVQRVMRCYMYMSFYCSFNKCNDT